MNFHAVHISFLLIIARRGMNYCYRKIKKQSKKKPARGAR